MTDAITTERYGQGLSWDGYLATVQANKEQFLANFQEFEVAAEDRAFFTSLAARRGPLHVLAIGEDWCPDVIANLPIVAKLCQTLGLDLRIFPRDQNLDIMNRYLNQGVYMSIPVIVFFDRDMNELGHWIERSAAAIAFMGRLRDDIAALGLAEEAARAERGRRVTQAYRESLRGETMRELRELLAA